MKVCPNGGIQLSILDGWWVEGYAQEQRLAIGAGEEYTIFIIKMMSRAAPFMTYWSKRSCFLLHALERRCREVAQSHEAVDCRLLPGFNTNRMFQDYVEKGYWPSCSVLRNLL